MRMYFKCNQSELFSLLVIFLSWLLLMVAKNGAFLIVDTIPLPSTLFWVGTGIFLSVFFFRRVIGIKDSPWKIKWKTLPLTFCLLIAYQLYFLHHIPIEKENTPYFFVWVPLLYWATSIIFYGERKDLVCFRLIPIAVLIVFLLKVVHSTVPVVATLFFVTSGLLAFNRANNLLSLILQGASIQILIAGFVSYFHWEGVGRLSMITVYGSFGGGVALGLSMMFFLYSFTFLRIWSSLIGMSLALMTDLALPNQGWLTNLFALPILFLAVISLRYVIGLKNKQDQILPDKFIKN